MGDRIVGINMIPFMRSIPVSVFVANMRPNTKMFAFFDNENVTDFFRPDDVLTITSHKNKLLILITQNCPFQKVLLINKII